MPNPLPYAPRSEEQKEKAREAQRRYRAAHPDKVAAQNERCQEHRREKYFRRSSVLSVSIAIVVPFETAASAHMLNSKK